MLDVVIKCYKNVQFYDSYKRICEMHSHNNMMSNVDKVGVLNTLSSLGYKEAKYNPKGSFFQIEDYQTNDIYNGRIRIGINITTKYGVVIFIISLIIDEIGNNGGPFDVICEKLGYENIPKPPRFSNLDEMRTILQEGLMIYAEIKKELIKLVSEIPMV